jgi:phage gpG-like protein
MESIGVSIAKAMARAQAEYVRAARVRLTEGMTELFPYITDNMHDSYPPRARTSIKTNRIYAAKNTTNKLYARSGALKRSLIPGQRGNIAKIISADQNEVVAEFGIDLEKIKYARVHEFGGYFSIISTKRTIKIPPRPYFYPGIQAYLDGHTKYIAQDILRAALGNFHNTPF